MSTFFEGEIVGGGKHTFLTEDWGADKASDWAHWQKCALANCACVSLVPAVCS